VDLSHEKDDDAASKI